MRSERNAAQNEKSKRSLNKKGKIAIGVLAVVLLLGGAGAYRIYSTDTFPKDARVDGIAVGGMTLAEAEKQITKEANKIELREDDNDAVTVTTKFQFDIAKPLKYRLALASVDPRNWLGSGGDYTVALKVSDGMEESAKVIRKKIPDRKGSTKTENAHINYEKMKIVKEVYGDTLDETALTEEIARLREEKPRQTTIEFKSSDYVLKPTVKSEDLEDELAFAKKYLKGGMTLRSASGETVQVTATQLAKVILYSESGPQYSEEGAKKVAKKIAKDFNQYSYTVDTVEGTKTLANYVIENAVDVDKTATSIYEAAKEGRNGSLYLKATNKDLTTRVEVSITNQKVYYVEKGKVKLRTDVVTGGGKNATPCGIFNLYYKEKNATLKGNNDDGSKYESKVSYWMPFNGGIGLHDASWRSTFGGSIYKTNGSHGCINMPTDQAKKLYNYVSAGTLVYVYE